MRRVGIVGTIIVVLTMTGGAPPSFAGEVNRAAEDRSFDLVNGERTDRGKPALRWKDDLARIARDHSQKMADDGELSHNDRLPQQVEGWEELAENVGNASDADTIHELFMDSAPHRNNILDSYVEIGVGAVEQDGELWLTQIFRTPVEEEEEEAEEPAPARRSWNRESPTASSGSTTRPIYRAATATRLNIGGSADDAADVETIAVDMLDRLSGEYEGTFVVNRMCRRHPTDC